MALGTTATADRFASRNTTGIFELDSSGNGSGKAATGSMRPAGALMSGARENRGIRDAALQQGLRAAYRTVIEEPLPDRLLALLQQLDGDGPTR
jgi:Anti-sigma factor NepR